MTDYPRRVVDAVVNSAAVPAKVRTRALRALGFDCGEDVCLWSGAILRSNRISFGDHCFVNHGFFYDGAGPVSIGSNVRMGQFVRIITASHRIGPSAQRCTIQADIAPVSVGDGCWIGASVTILPGVDVARGCVIAAGAVVTSSTRPDGLYAGVPARRISDLPA